MSLFDEDRVDSGAYGEVVSMFREMAVAAKKTDLKSIETGDDRKIVYFKDDGSTLEFTKRLPARKHKVASIDDFIKAVAVHWAIPEDEVGPWGSSPIVWHNDTALTFFPDDSERRDSVTCELVPSMQMQSLARLVTKAGEPAKRIKQGALLEIIRLDLAGCISDSNKLETLIRNVKWQRTESGSSIVNRGDESFDSDIKAEVIGFKDAPDFVQVTIPVYRNPGENVKERRYTVLCALDIDVDEKAFMFRPVPNGLQEAIDQAQAEIRERIETAAGGVPIYNGVA